MMGMESYFFTVSICTSLSENRVKEYFDQHYKVTPYSRPSGKFFRHRIKDPKRFVIDKKAVVDMKFSGNKIYCTFELCFSNYSENLLYIYNVAKGLCFLGNFAYLIVLKNQYDFSNMDFKLFEQLLYNAFKTKFCLFKQKYGLVKQNILPHDFYNKIRWLK